MLAPVKKHSDERAEHLRRLADRKAQTQRLTAKHKLRFVHVRHRDDNLDKTPHAGATIAYSFPSPTGDLIRVGVALCHKNDRYCRADGRFNAALHFDMGDTVLIRVPKNMVPSDLIQRMFFHVA
jgi:hypothetical protein